MKKKRLDDFLIEKRWITTKKEAFVAVTEGRVFVNGRKSISPSELANIEDRIEIRSEARFVGRGAYKLAAALRNFQVAVDGKICADLGSATGGFTQVLLEAGAKRVFSIDTAKGKISLKLRREPRVTVMENTDVRGVKRLPETPDLVTIDISLIPLREVLPAVMIFAPASQVIALLKPQYETRNKSILKHGIVKEESDRFKILSEFKKWAQEHGWQIKGEMESPILGGKGNKEFLLWLTT